MIYQKPKDVTYTEMCMYIDDNVYKDNFDERLVYEYIYHIVYMLAKKAQYFKKNSYYDDFAISVKNACDDFSKTLQHS